MMGISFGPYRPTKTKPTRFEIRIMQLSSWFAIRFTKQGGRFRLIFHPTRVDFSPPCRRAVSFTSCWRLRTKKIRLICGKHKDAEPFLALFQPLGIQKLSEMLMEESDSDWSDSDFSDCEDDDAKEEFEEKLPRKKRTYFKRCVICPFCFVRFVVISFRLSLSEGIGRQDRGGSIAILLTKAIGGTPLIAMASYFVVGCLTLSFAPWLSGIGPGQQAHKRTSPPVHSTTRAHYHTSQSTRPSDHQPTRTPQCSSSHPHGHPLTQPARQPHLPHQPTASAPPAPCAPCAP